MMQVLEVMLEHSSAACVLRKVGTEEDEIFTHLHQNLMKKFIVNKQILIAAAATSIIL